MLNNELTDQFTSYFERLMIFYNEFFQLETEKNNSLKNAKLDRLDRLMREEEAYVLRARGLELERQELMKRTDRPGAVFSELLPCFPPDRREKLQQLFDSLSSTLLKMKKMSEESNHLLKTKARTASALLEKLDGSPDLQRVYNKKVQAQASARGASILFKKI